MVERFWTADEPGNYHTGIRVHGGFLYFSSNLRVFRLPEIVDTTKIHAELRNGILNLHLAKAESAKPAPEAKRAQALLDGKSGESAAAAGDGPHVVLIGAFSNPGNVQTLQKKLGELGLKVYTESLDSPQGKKTRVRAGPFPSREAAERAVARMKSIGVGGETPVIASGGCPPVASTRAPIRSSASPSRF